MDTSSSTIPDSVSEGSGTSNTSATLSDGTSHYFHLRTVDNAGNWTSTRHLGPFYIDTVRPDKPTATPGAGDYSSSQSVLFSSSDGASGVLDIYYTKDGSTPTVSGGLHFDPGIAVVVDKDMTIKAVAFDKAGNSSDELEAPYGIAPAISGEDSAVLSETSVTITWTTANPATSRVVYDTVSHPGLGSAPNYGYANSTSESDTSTKVTSHSVTISALAAGTTYYYRTVSKASPESQSSEKSFTTSAAVLAATTIAVSAGEVLGTESEPSKVVLTVTPTPTAAPESSAGVSPKPTSVGEVAGESISRNFLNGWLIFILIILGVGGLLYWSRRRES